MLEALGAIFLAFLLLFLIFGILPLSITMMWCWAMRKGKV